MNEDLAQEYDRLYAEWLKLRQNHKFEVERDGTYSIPRCSCGEWSGDSSRKRTFALQDQWRREHFNFEEQSFRRATGFVERLIPHDILSTQYGPVDSVIGTGRAMCRVCLRRIQKGEKAVIAAVDMSPDRKGSWGTIRVQAHEACVRPIQQS